MKSSNAIVAGVVAALAFASTPEIAEAQPKHCPPGHAMKGWCDFDGGRRFRDRDRDDFDHRSRLDFEDALDEAYEEGFHDGRREAFRIGDRLARDRYRILDRDLYYDRYGRPLPDSYYYAESSGERLLIEAATGAIIDILTR